MASRIKGITVEIGGDTTKLDKALSDVNKNLGDTQRSLKDVERLLKLDPSNVTLLEQKQRLLATAVNDTSKKLDTLKTAAQQAGEALKKGTIDQSQYDALQREIVDTERKLKDLTTQQKNTADSTNDLAKSTKGLSDSMEDVKDGSKKFGDILPGVTKAVTALGAAAIAAVPATEDFRDGMSKLKTTAQLMNVSINDAQKAFEDFYRVSGDTDSSYEAANNLLNLRLQGEGLTTAVDLLSAAVIRFPDTVKIESLADSLQETVATGEATGQFAELLGRLGVNTEEFAQSLAMYADEGKRLDIALSALAANGLAGVTDAWAAENEQLIKSRDAKLKMQETVAALAEDLVPLITKVTELAASFLEWFNGLSDGSKTAVVSLAAIVAAIGPVTNALSGIIQILPTVTALFGKLDAKSLALAAILALLVTTVVAISDAWEDMSTLEKVVSVLGALTIAAVAAAVAVGALQSAWSMGLAAAAIVAGVVAITAAVTSAKNRAEAAASSAAKTTNIGNVPALADGAVLYPNKPFLAMVGDQRSGVNVEAPMSTIKQGVREVMNERGGGGSVTRVEFTGSLAQLGRVLKPVITTEADRAGTSMRK